MPDACEISGCEKPRYCRGWCRMHYVRWQRHGDPLMVKSSAMPGQRNGRWKERPGTRAAHLRVRAARGEAAAHQCINCGSQAREWSYDHNDPEPLFDSHGYAYSLRVDCYSPRCISCHRMLDRFKARFRAVMA